MRNKAVSYKEPSSSLIRFFMSRSGSDGAATAEQIMAGLIEKMQRKKRGNELQDFLEKRRINQVEMVSDLNCDGRIDPLGMTFADGFKISLKRGGSQARMRFTMAHELCHTFFYELVPEMKFVAHEPVEEEERLCNFGAAALLIPARSLRKYISDLPICLDSLRFLANEFTVSLATMLLRLKSLSLWKNHQLSFWHRLVNGTFVQERLYGGRQVVWKWEDDSILEKAWDSGESLIGRTFISCGDHSKMRRYKPISYQVCRSADGIMALWGNTIESRPARVPLPLFETDRPSFHAA